MISISGPDNQVEEPFPGNPEITRFKSCPDEVDASTLGEALAFYSKKYGVSFVPYDGSDPDYVFWNEEPAKYFWFDGKPSFKHQMEPGSTRRPVDIHVTRGYQTLCPKQDLSFALLPGDKIIIDPMLAC